MSYTIILSSVFGAVIAVLLVISSIISFKENEPTAAKRLLFLVVPVLLIYCLTPMFITGQYYYIILILVLLPVLFLLILIIPAKHIVDKSESNLSYQIDERDIMFSRKELKEGTERYEAYYRDKKDILTLDNEFRKQPGLMSPDSKYYSKFGFNASDVLFDVIDMFHGSVTGDVNPLDNKFNKIEFTKFIKNWTKHLGAHSVGITKLEKYHLYSVKGRGSEYGDIIDNNHEYAVAFTVEMDKKMLDSAPKVTAIMETSKQYLEGAKIATLIAKWIRSMGYDARTHIDGNYQVVCPLVARDAGLGEVGRMGLLMTPKLGPRVRVAVVTTSMPLNIDKPFRGDSVIDFCTICKKCADTCPGNAIQNTEREMINGTLRWQISSEKCFTYWCKAGTDCGRCVSVCPYSHPDNLMHNIIRYGISNSRYFARVAFKIDDFLYGRRPKPKRLPDWVND
jgi:reductive dehalogenase